MSTRAAVVAELGGPNWNVCEPKSPSSRNGVASQRECLLLDCSAVYSCWFMSFIASAPM
jgi:hypothetical protein